MKLTCPIVLLACVVAGFSVNAQKGVTVHGSVQSDILFPEDDEKIGTEHYKEKALTNSYADVGVYSKYVDGGLRLEYLEHPLPGFREIDEDFKGWGVPNIYVKGKFKGLELTAGDFYEQFGNGFILRTYEERSLGIDNSIRGGRLKVNSFRGIRFTALGGLQRRFWDWDSEALVFGGDLEFDLNEYIKGLSKRNIIWTVGASYVLKNEDKEDIIVPGTNYKLNLPGNVNAFDVRTSFYRGGLNLLGEFAWKSQDPSFDNDYTYRHGNALMLSAAYSKTGWSALVQVKRSEDMSFRSRRSDNGIASTLNNMPAFSYQHTYSLAALYPYATQSAPGEWAFQGAFAYTFKRKTALGGKYGTKLKLNVSYIRGLHHTDKELFNNYAYGTGGDHTSFFKMGELYYQDINLQVEKKVTQDFQFNFMYMNQKYNKTVVEGHGGMIKSNILVLEPKYRFSRNLTLRGEFQYLFTCQDQKDWAFGLLELSILPYVMVSVSDQWNCGDTKTHYYMATVTGNYKSNRLMLGYGRTRAGFNCSGGVCRYVPASRGFQISYNYTF